MLLKRMITDTQAVLGNQKGALTSAVDAKGNLIYAQLPPWVEMPEKGKPFEEVGSINLPPVNPAVEETILTFKVPDGLDGVIKRYSCNFGGGGFVQMSGDLIWRIYVDTQVVENFVNILNERGTMQNPKDLTGGLRIFSGQTISLRITHAANNTLSTFSKVSGSFEGWYYDIAGY